MSTFDIAVLMFYGMQINIFIYQSIFAKEIKNASDSFVFHYIFVHFTKDTRRIKIGERQHRLPPPLISINFQIVINVILGCQRIA